MCRLIALTSDEPQSPILAIRALDVMREGHDGSGVGLFMSDLSGPFEELKGLPILSGIFTGEGVKRLDQYMMSLGFHDQAQGFHAELSKNAACWHSQARRLCDPRLRISSILGGT